MRFTFLLSISLFILASCHPTDIKESPDFLAEDIDTTVSPASDFYLYANGNWMKRNPIPDDQSRWSIGSLVQLDIYNRLRAINEKATADSSESGSISQKIGDFWFSGMDSSGMEKLGIEPLLPDLIKIDQIKDLDDLFRVSAGMVRSGMDPFMATYIGQDDKKSDQIAYFIYQGGLGMPNREYYFKTDARSEKVRAAYQTYLFKSFRTLGKDSVKAVLAADAVFQFEKKLASFSRKMADLRDPNLNYHKMSLAFMEEKYTNIPWLLFLREAGLPTLDSVIVGQPEFLTGINQELKKTPLDVLKDYLCFHLLDNSAAYLNKTVFMDRFEYSRTLSGVAIPKPRWKRVLDAEEDAIGEALGQLFVKEYFSEKSKQRYTDMVEAMREAYRDRIKQVSWMSDSTKKRALIKLAGITKKVGYPDKWRDFSALIIDRGPFVLNMKRASEWWYHDAVKKLGKPVDRTIWEMTPQTYNAYYNPSNNEIVIPAGQFMVPGKKDEDLDDAFLYGYVAASTIGHEMTHGFDDQGRKFDVAGNLNDWWQPQDAQKYGKSAAKIVSQFNEFIPVDTIHVNGEASQGENIADLGGLQIGWDAFIKSAAYKEGKKIGGFTPAQRYFLGYAYSWANNTRKDRLASQLLTDVHAPAKERVNGPLANMPAFYEAFGVKPGDKMYRADSLRVVIW